MTEGELSVVLRFVFAAFGRELTDSDLSAYAIAIGMFGRDEVTAASKTIVRDCESCPVPATFARVIRDQRITANKNMTSETKRNMRIAVIVREARLAGKSRAEVEEIIERLESGVTDRTGSTPRPSRTGFP